ncbi:LuxR C-terminal-related transcriptional regulator [Erwiniaceae bacterium CAU 1747]
MSYIILNKCDYFSHGLKSIINEAGGKKRDIHLLDNLAHFARLLQEGSTQIAFICESVYKTEHDREAIKKLIAMNPQTLFIIFMRVVHSSFEDYIYIQPNVVIMAKNVSIGTVKNLISTNKLKQSSLPAGLYPADETPLSFSKRESEILNLWMKERSSVEISEHINIKLKTVLSHKNNLKKKSKSRRTTVLFQIINLAKSLTHVPHLN